MRIFAFVRTKLIPTSVLKRRMKTSKSPLMREFFRNPGGWQSMELIYENAKPANLSDWYALKRLPLSMEARNRRKYVLHEFVSWMQENREREKLRILALGSGPALEIQEAILATSSNVIVDAVDRDASAIERGQQVAQERGLNQQISYCCGDVCEMMIQWSEKRYDLISLIGIIEYLPDEVLLSLLKQLKNMMSPNAELFTHGYQNRFGAQESLGKLFNIQLIERTSDQVTVLLNQAGLRVVKSEVTPLGAYPMIVSTQSREPAKEPISANRIAAIVDTDRKKSRLES
ncbi:SAM-dependent methyltransferase [Rubinisphaera italica]|nr:class I SAM-dependent methyltransferase [Rubinisphaera italica]